MTEMISQCPKCMTSFRVSEEQLQMAGGKVRCGYCMNVFMGRDYLVSGGDTDGGMADEDVLRSLIDPDLDSPRAAPAVEAAPDALADASLATPADQSFAFDPMAEAPGQVQPYSQDSDTAASQTIEPDLQLLEGNLKFDEEDLRSSADEDWALQLLAELEDAGPAASADSLELDSAQADDIFAEPAPATENAGESGVGVEEITVDHLPPGQLPGDDWPPLAESTAGEADSEARQDLGEPERQAEQTEAVDEPPAAAVLAKLRAKTLQQPETEPESEPEPEADDADIFSYEFANTEGKPTVEAQAGEAEAADQTDEPVPAQGLFEDAASVYQAEDADAASVESEQTQSGSLLELSADSGLAAEPPEADGSIPQRRQSDVLPQHLEIEESAQALQQTPQAIEWKWIAGSAGLLVLLFLQYAFFYFDSLVASPKTRPMMSTLCTLVRCDLPEYRDLSSISTDQLTVRTHPETDNALIVDIIIKNNAGLSQPFPVLQLTFFDIRSQAVASRKFFPTEYLDGELRGLSSMPSQSPIRLALEIMDPGADAINYQLNLLPTL